MTLKGKLLTGFLSSTALVLILAIIGYIQISQLNKGLSTSKHQTISTVSKDIEAIKTANKISALTQKIRFATNTSELKAINPSSEANAALEGSKELNIDAEQVQNQFERLHSSRTRYYEIKEELPQTIEALKLESEEFVQETFTVLVEFEENAINQASNSSLNNIKKEKLKVAKTAKIAKIQTENIPDFSNAYKTIESMQFSINSLDSNTPLDEFKKAAQNAMTVTKESESYFSEEYSSLHKNLAPLFLNINETLGQVIDFQPVLSLSEPNLTPTQPALSLSEPILTPTESVSESVPSPHLIAPVQSRPPFNRAELAKQLNQISNAVFSYADSKSKKSVSLITKSVQRIHNSLSSETKSTNNAISSNYETIAHARDDFNQISTTISSIFAEANRVLSTANDKSFERYSKNLNDKLFAINGLKDSLVENLRAASGSDEMGTKLTESIDSILLSIVAEDGVGNQLEQLTIKNNSMKASESQISKTLDSLNNESIVRSKNLASTLAAQLDSGIEKANSTRNWIIYTCIAVMILSAVIGIELPRRISNKLTNMSDTMGEVSRSLSVAAEQVLSTSTQLADGASNQAASLEETTA